MATEIRVPTLGESVTEATVGQWYKKVGDTVKADEPLVELETDKITLEVPAPAAGVIEAIEAKDGVDRGGRRAARTHRRGRRCRRAKAKATPRRGRPDQGRDGAARPPAPAAEGRACCRAGRRWRGAPVAGGREDPDGEGHRAAGGRGHRPRRPDHQGRRDDRDRARLAAGGSAGRADGRACAVAAPRTRRARSACA